MASKAGTKTPASTQKLSRLAIRLGFESAIMRDRQLVTPEKVDAVASAKADFNAIASMPIVKIRKLARAHANIWRTYVEPEKPAKAKSRKKRKETGLFKIFAQHVKATPIDPALMAWHQENLEALYLRVARDAYALESLVRIHAAGDGSDRLRKSRLMEGLEDFAHVVAEIWNMPAPGVSFGVDRLKDDTLGDAQTWWCKNNKGEEYVASHIRIRLENPETGKLYSGARLFDTLMHELAHVAEENLVMRLLFERRRFGGLAARHKPFFAEDVTDAWPLKAAAVHFAQNDETLGTYMSIEKYGFPNYYAQLRERHARWFATTSARTFESIIKNLPENGFLWGPRKPLYETLMTHFEGLVGCRLYDALGMESIVNHTGAQHFAGTHDVLALADLLTHRIDFIDRQGVLKRIGGQLLPSRFFTPDIAEREVMGRLAALAQLIKIQASPIEARAAAIEGDSMNGSDGVRISYAPIPNNRGLRNLI